MSYSPFPGMDPYLEAPTIWPDVHTSLISIFREQLDTVVKILSHVHPMRAWCNA